MLCKCNSYRRNYASCMNPAVNGSSEIQRFECSDAIKIHDGIIYLIFTQDSHIRSFLALLPDSLWKLGIGDKKGRDSLSV